MKNLILVARDTTTREQKSISIFNKKDELIAKVFCDGETGFSKINIQIDELKQIVTIAENFNLFWNNIYN